MFMPSFTCSCYVLNLALEALAVIASYLNSFKVGQEVFSLEAGISHTNMHIPLLISTVFNLPAFEVTHRLKISRVSQ